jgi:nucleotide-binding universal stress UspA family protein
MTYTTLLVAPTLGKPNTRLLEVAGSLADRFGAGVIGVGASRPVYSIYRDYPVPAAVFEEDRKQIARQVRVAETEFRTIMACTKQPVEWRARTSTIPLAEHLAQEARAADLLVVGMEKIAAMPDTTRKPDVCDLVMQAGRPVLLVPAAASMSRFERVVVAWKDTREARRAIVDALPFLSKASKVTVIEIVPEESLAEARSRLAEVVAWLSHHAIVAEAKAVPSTTANAVQLNAIADELEADLIVAGAYGYSRQGKWVLGGITSDLLAGNRCALVAH